MSTLDDYLHLLANEHRRELLRALRDDQTGVISVDSDDPLEQARLYHVHLPKLANAGLVNWDRREGLVVKGPSFDDVVPLLDALDEVRGSGRGNGEVGKAEDDSEDGKTENNGEDGTEQ